jgi:hypothetical protein
MYVTERAKKRNGGLRKNSKLNGAIAQLGEHLLCKQGVRGSIPRSSTIIREVSPAGRQNRRFSR